MSLLESLEMSEDIMTHLTHTITLTITTHQYYLLPLHYVNTQCSRLIYSVILVPWLTMLYFQLQVLMSLVPCCILTSECYDGFVKLV